MLLFPRLRISMNQDEMKMAAAKAALEYVPVGEIIGIGTGSTANHFIDLLAGMKHKIDGTVASSEASADRLRGHGIEVLELNQVNAIPIYVDGADEATEHLALIKGGGGALTREKIIAAASDKFICVADDTKLVNRLGAFPLPIEVIPMARSLVARQLRQFGEPVYREGFVTDNGNIILDIHNMDILDPVAMETELNQITGVVTVGLFARRGADVMLLAGENGVRTLA